MSRPSTPVGEAFKLGKRVGRGIEKRRLKRRMDTALTFQVTESRKCQIMKEVFEKGFKCGMTNDTVPTGTVIPDLCDKPGCWRKATWSVKEKNGRISKRCGWHKMDDGAIHLDLII
jgi:hypothetical protein